MESTRQAKGAVKSNCGDTTAGGEFDIGFTTTCSHILETYPQLGQSALLGSPSPSLKAPR